MTFWCRRWTEQSRSNRWITLPCAVGEDLHLDVARVDHGLLDEGGRVAEGALGLAHAASTDSRSVLGSSTRRMPRPPPPATALTKTGKPIVLGAATSASRSADGGGRLQRRDAGRLGRRERPDLVAGQLEHVGGGPMKVIPASAQASARSGFSLRKP